MLFETFSLSRSVVPSCVKCFFLFYSFWLFLSYVVNNFFSNTLRMNLYLCPTFEAFENLVKCESFEISARRFLQSIHCTLKYDVSCIFVKIERKGNEFIELLTYPVFSSQEGRNWGINDYKHWECKHTLLGYCWTLERSFLPLFPLGFVDI